MFAAGKAASGAEPTDAQFNYVTMLLHGNGTNGAQNNTFVDSSTNNFTITRNGNTTQGTFTPYGSNWSNYFSSNSGLTAPNNSAFKPATNDFTVEAWIFSTSTGQQIVYGDSDSATNNGVLDLYLTSSGFLASDYWTSSTAVTTRTSTLAPTINQWNHVLVSRTGTTMYIGLNGVLQSFTAPSSYQSPATIYPTVGRLGAYAAGVGFIGYISNFRFINGTNLYSGSTYTVPTAPLTAVTNTSLLTCQSNRFIDNSTNSFALTVNGSPSVQRFSPFSPTTAYSTSVIGGSGYFDGSGDYLSVSNTGLFGSGDWTFECWVNAPVGQTDKPIIDARNSAGGSGSTTGFTIGMITSTEIRVWSNGEKIRATANYVNQWLHIALVKSGSTTTMYFNGVSVGTTTGIGTMSDTSFLVGAGYYGSTSINAYGNFYTSNMRVVKGSAVYTSNFTPPTAPVTAITSTALLMDYTNAGILDNAMMNDLETVGNAQISTSVKKYGTGSMAFDGSGDYLLGPSSQNYAFNTGDFTVECWVYINSNQSYATLIDTTGNAGNTGSVGWILEFSATRGMSFYFANGASFLGYTTTPTTATWTHLAVTRSGSTARLFINGTVVASGTYTNNITNNASISIGAAGGNQFPFNGYIDDLRITKGVARYTTTFTPPTAAFADKG